MPARIGSRSALMASFGEIDMGIVTSSIGSKLFPFGPSTSTTYTAGQVLLAPVLFDVATTNDFGSGFLFGSTLALNVANAAQVDLVVFNSQPSGGYAAGSTFAMPAADQARSPKVLHIDDWTAMGAASSLGQCSDKGARPFQCADPTNRTSLWALLVARGSITLASATDGNLSVHAVRN